MKSSNVPKITKSSLIGMLLFSTPVLGSKIAEAKKNSSFESAIRDAKVASLTEVHEQSSGVPFYSIRTLDPNWQESGATPIVRIDSLNLIDQDGTRITESIFDNKISFVAFFFSSCAGFCPTFLQNLQHVEEQLKKLNLKDLPETQFVAISVDPDRDQPQQLKAYFKKMGFQSSWTLLTGDKENIFALARETFASEAFQLPKSKNQFSHSEHFYVLDSKRRLRGVLKGTRVDVAEKAQDLLTALHSSNLY